MDHGFEAGQSATAEMLSLALPTAPGAYLAGALQNPALAQHHLLLVLKNPSVVPPLIAKISRNPRWLKPYEIKAAIVLHPGTPRSVAMNLVGFLWWRDLVRVADGSRLPPLLRRSAERLLTLRLDELALGEKLSLARIASRGVIGMIRRDENPAVIRALLQNPRLVEEDVLAIAANRRATGAILEVLAEDPRFAQRTSVRKAIARHPGTPSRVALRIVQALGTRDLRELTTMPQVPGLVRVAARRLMESRRGGPDTPTGRA